MTMPITSVMRCRFIDPSRPPGQPPFGRPGVYQWRGRRTRGLMELGSGPSPALSRALVDDASPPDRVPHVGEGSDVCGRIALEGDEIGGTSAADPPPPPPPPRGPGRGAGPRRPRRGERKA